MLNYEIEKKSQRKGEEAMSSQKSAFGRLHVGFFI
jgi:hypothetical protein